LLRVSRQIRLQKRCSQTRLAERSRWIT
jgi:hypothetical protein